MNQYICAFFNTEDEALLAASKLKQSAPCEMISIREQNDTVAEKDAPFSDLFIPFFSESYSSFSLIPETFNFDAVAKHDHAAARHHANTHAVVSVKTSAPHASAVESILLSCGGQSLSKTNIP